MIETSQSVLALYPGSYIGEEEKEPKSLGTRLSQFQFCASKNLDPSQKMNGSAQYIIVLITSCVACQVRGICRHDIALLQ